MTPDQIERTAERRMDALDARLMRGALTQSEYDREVRALHRWTERQHNAQRHIHALQRVLGSSWDVTAP